MSYCHPKCHHTKNRVASADNSTKTRDCSSVRAIVQNICTSDITDEALEQLIVQAVLRPEVLPYLLDPGIQSDPLAQAIAQLLPASLRRLQ